MLEIAMRPAPPLDAFQSIASDNDDLRVSPLGPKARLSLRLRDEDAIARFGEAFGTPLPREACRFNDQDGQRALWLGPDEWLLIVPGADSGALSEEIERTLEGVPHSLVDVSHRSAGIAVSGPKAEALLSAGCPLDLDLRAFPVGMATRTVLGKSEIVLMRFAPEEFQIDVWRSFAAYVWGLLTEAAREHARSLSTR